jgi:hypothetical protein
MVGADQHDSYASALLCVATNGQSPTKQRLLNDRYIIRTTKTEIVKKLP